MNEQTCDVAIIGAGTAGLAAERQAREAGASTRLIDPAFDGTTCATVGCMPSKLLIAAADAAWAVEHADTFGVQATATVDSAAVLHRLRLLRDRFVAHVQETIADIPAAVRISSRARFEAAGRLLLDDRRRVNANAVVIATGAAPAVPPPFESLDAFILTNERLFELTELPRSVAVLGAGPLGLEFAQALSRLGVRVAVFDKAASIGGVQDAGVASAWLALLRRELPVHTGVEPDITAGADGGVRVSWDGTSQVFDRFLLAVGRPPSLDGLDLASTGIALDDHDVPLFDPATLRCGDSCIFIAGDANHDRPLLHEAADEGRIAGNNAARYPKVTDFQRKLPFVLTYTRPEAAEVGNIPDERDTGYVSAVADYDDQGRARIEARLGGLCRLYAERDGGRLVAASLCVPDAGHLAHSLAIAIDAGLTADDLLATPFYHPTLEEGLKPALRALSTLVARGLDEHDTRPDTEYVPEESTT